jgi:membrane-associated protein
MIEIIAEGLDLIIHIEEYLPPLIGKYGLLIYLILFLLFFAETGFVVTPFIPGDSLLFVLGAMSAQGMLDVTSIIIVLIIAAILGDTANYWIGNKIGLRFLDRNLPFIEKDHIKKTERFFERYGGITIIIARFVPYVRTFAPFLAGVGKMHYRTFLGYNVVGGVLWIVSVVVAGYLFGNIPVVEDNFNIIIIGVLVITVIAVIVAGAQVFGHLFRHWWRNRRKNIL